MAVEEIHRRFPGVPLATTAWERSYGMSSRLDAIDIFIPNSWEYFPDRAAKSRKAGHQVWWYICNGPRAPYANWFIECQAIEARLLMGAIARAFSMIFPSHRELLTSALHVCEGESATLAFKGSAFRVLGEERLGFRLKGAEVQPRRVAFDFIEVKPPGKFVLAD